MLVDRIPLLLGAAVFNASKLVAVKRIRADARNTIGNHDTRQAATVEERPIADARNTIWYHDARQAATAAERPIADACHASICGNNAIFTSCNQRLTCCLNQTISG